jgi:ribosomal protein S18 acetylase RimI-like enzyme
MKANELICKKGYKALNRISFRKGSGRLDQNKVIIIPYESKYAEQTVEMWRESKDEAIGQKEVHSFESHVYFSNHILHKKYQIDLALWNETVVGIIAYNESEINQLYIHNDYQGKGIGKSLLIKAKEQSSGRLTLYTFEINKKAQRFYEMNGFKIIDRGHENEENLPDILYEWVAN